MRTSRRFTGLTLGLAGALVLGASGAQAGLTSEACVAQKLRVWVNLRKCQGLEKAKAIQGTPADLAKCQTKFQDKLTTLQEKASTAAVPCRYADNGDNTVTDYDTGLMWVKFSGLDGVPQPYILDADDSWDWKTSIEVASSLNGPSDDGTTITPVPGNGLYTDWRLPTVQELESIVDTSQSACAAATGACIDPIFGPTQPSGYWSSTTYATDPGYAWLVGFQDGTVGQWPKSVGGWGVREVRRGL
jgi:hypothetical protein